MDEFKNLASSARKFVEDYITPDIVTIIEPRTGNEALVEVGKDGVQQVQPSVFDPWRVGPIRRKGTANLTKVEALIDHVNRFSDANSVLFAIDDRKSPSLTAVLNYHEAVNAVVGSDGERPILAGADHTNGAPRFGDHRAVFKFPLSDEWQAWHEFNGRLMPLRDFAQFLEDRIVDVIDLIGGEDELPEALQKYINLCGGIVASQAKLVEMSRGFTVHEAGKVEERINPNTGEVTFTFVSEHVDAAGQKLTIPNVILIAIPIFKHGPLYRIAARLRYRKAGDGMKLMYELWRADAAFDDAFGQACERVQVETDLPLLFGTPE